MTQTSDHECALTRAASVQAMAANKGFDWPGPDGALEKVSEETNEVAVLMARRGGRGSLGGLDEEQLFEEVGDLLFAVVNLARLLGIDPASALGRATAKFGRRFAEVERIARRRGLPMPGTELGPLDRIWDEVKGRGF
jgi:uncharacterized protein YabN with tetrapyrrole methylase and pyrophosphatase domain